MAQPATIAFMAKDNIVVEFRNDLLPFCEFLFMIARRNNGQGPIKTNVMAHDIRLTEAICQICLYPCPYQTRVRPQDFETSIELGDFMGIQGVDTEDDVDLDNEYIDEFLSHLGLESDGEDAPPDLTPSEDEELAMETLKDLSDDEDFDEESHLMY